MSVRFFGAQCKILIHKGSKVSYQHLFTQTNYKEKKTIQQ